MSYDHPQDKLLNSLHNALEYGASGQPIIRTTTAAGAAGADGFGRLRVSEPLTLFDSTHRFTDNDLWTEDTTGTASSAFQANEGLVHMTVGTAENDEIRRETNKVFAYQPGKSLLILTSFVFAAPQANLRQRVGYFGTENGMYLEQYGSQITFVERKFNTGSVVEERDLQADWNVDPMDGTGPSRITLDFSKAQIMWMDLEWLGVGTVRVGFIVEGKLHLCHVHYHANVLDTTYMTTGSLPLRQELANFGGATTGATMKQICSSVISEGGYELRGRQQAIGTPISSPKALTTAGTFYPVVSIRLKTSPNRLDAIVILTAVSLMGSGSNINYEWRVAAGGTVTGGAWASAGTNSSVNYNLSGTGHSGGRILASGYLNSSNQSSPALNILKEALFKFQLERDTFTSTPAPLTLLVASGQSSQECFGSIDWEEITR